MRFWSFALGTIGFPFIWFVEKIGRLACRRSENVRSSRNTRELRVALCSRQFRLGGDPVRAIASACIGPGLRAGFRRAGMVGGVFCGGGKQAAGHDTR